MLIRRTLAKPSGYLLMRNSLEREFIIIIIIIYLFSKIETYS